MKLVHLHNCLPKASIDHALERVMNPHKYKSLLYFEYNNPFERKIALDKSTAEATFFQALIQPSLTSYQARWWISRLLDINISYANWTHSGGVFHYRPGDYLHPHVDAGRHQGQVHVATALLYLTPAELFFWHGEPGHYQKPVVYHVTEIVKAAAGDLILFTNTDDSWHSVPITHDDRVVITVGYMAHDDFKHRDYSNTREHAYFARIEGESTEYDDLREARAQGREYRTSVPTSSGPATDT